MIAATAGCSRSERNWTLRVQSAYDEQTEGGLETLVEIAFGGQSVGEDVVTDVRVCALDGDGALLKSTPIGRMSPGERREANTTLLTETVPAELVLDYGSVKTDANFNLKGMERSEDGVYSSFHQDGPQCGR